MKKVYLIGLALTVAGLGANAQRTAKNYTFGHQKLKANIGLQENNNSNPVRPVNAVSGDRAINILWTEDFSGATGLTTTVGTWTTEGVDAAYWEIGTNPYVGFGDGLTGDYLTWDSYTANQAVTDASIAVNGSVYSPAMDLSSSTTGAVLKMDVDARYCCSYQDFPFLYSVSSDDGATWSTPVQMDYGIDRNDDVHDIAEPLTVYADLTPFLDATPANNDDVRIKFTWEGSIADGNGQYNTYYFWMIDNIEVWETPPYEANHQRLWLDDIALGYEYGDIPTDQAQALTVQSKLLYLGSNTNPTNFGLEVTVFDGGTTNVVHPAETGGVLTNPLATGIVDTITFTTSLDMGTLPTGMYDVRAVITYDETDEVPSNDTVWRSFQITDHTLSHIDYEQVIGSNEQSSDTKAEIGATFPIYANTTLHGIDIYIDNANSGDFVDVLLYQDNGATIDYLAGPWTFELTAGMIGGWTTLNLYNALQPYSPIPLGAGNSYVPVVVVDQGQIFDYGANGTDEDNSGIFYHDVDGTWYLTGDEPLIAINTDQSLSIGSENDLDFAIGQNIPNPFENNSVISYTLENAANVSVSFTDVSGKTVRTINNGSQNAGTYTLTIDAADFAEGVYFYTFTIGEKQVTKRMVVSK